MATGKHAKKNAFNGNRDAGRQSHRKRRVHQSLQGGVEPGREDVHRVPNGGRDLRPRKEQRHPRHRRPGGPLTPPSSLCRCLLGMWITMAPKPTCSTRRSSPSSSGSFRSCVGRRAHSAWSWWAANSTVNSPTGVTAGRLDPRDSQLPLAHLSTCCLLILTTFPRLHPGCSEPMGMKSRLVSNRQITASSAFRTWGMEAFAWHPHLARLDKQGKTNAWTAATTNRSEWLQVLQPPPSCLLFHLLMLGSCSGSAGRPGVSQEDLRDHHPGRQRLWLGPVCLRLQSGSKRRRPELDHREGRDHQDGQGQNHPQKPSLAQFFHTRRQFQPHQWV